MKQVRPIEKRPQTIKRCQREMRKVKTSRDAEKMGLFRCSPFVLGLIRQTPFGLEHLTRIEEEPPVYEVHFSLADLVLLVDSKNIQGIQARLELMARPLEKGMALFPHGTVQGASRAVRQAQVSAIVQLRIYGNHIGWATIPLTVLPELDTTFQADDYMRVGPHLSDEIKTLLTPLAERLDVDMGAALVFFVMSYSSPEPNVVADPDQLMTLLQLEFSKHIRICGHCQRRGLRLDLCAGCKKVSYCGTR